MNIPTLDQWKRGLQIAEQIAALEKELAAVLHGQSHSVAPVAESSRPAAAKKAKRKLSPQALANIRAAQKRRWAKVKAGNKAPAAAKSAAPKAPEKKKRTISPAIRAKLAAAMKARWAAAKKTGGPLPTARKK